MSGTPTGPPPPREVLHFDPPAPAETPAAPAARRSFSAVGRSAGVRRFSWAVLVVLLVALVAAAATFSRAGWPGLVGDEATYLMQAESLAFDRDLVYERADYDRFVARHGGPPEGLILQKTADAERPTFGKPALYALWIAPFVRFLPTSGAPLANALLLVLAALVAARTLERRIGAAAPTWVAVWCFASVAFAYAFWAHADLFLLATAALGLALAYRGEAAAVAKGSLPDLYEPPGGLGEAGSRWRPLLRWAVAGALLAVPGAFRPFYLALLLPALVAARAEAVVVFGWRRWQRPLALVAGALALLAATAGAQLAAGGDWTAYGGERQGFYVRTGFPEVDFPADGWDESVRRWGNTSWLFDGALGAYTASVDPALWGWNGVYLLVWRNVGVLAYFLPLLLGVFLFTPRHGRWLIPIAVLMALAGFLLVRPFNFYGGGGAIANRYFLPLYPALWFLAGRAAGGPTADRRRLFAALAVAVLAAPFLLPLWSAPRAFPIGDDGRYRHVSEAARRLLPHETTQSHVPGGRDASLGGLWVKVLEGPVERTPGGGIEVTGGGRTTLLVGSPRPLEALRLGFAAGGPSQIELAGAELGGTLLAGDGSVAFLLELGRPRAVHPMWWSEEPWTLHEITFTPTGAARAAAPGALTLEPASLSAEELLR
ncbi:MAG TPA: hypothetical protein VM617_06455 [Thermoanaerobaculia bacterium]|nr:hypothetical protein [Thermoanaerobaculia bacterium]